MHHPLPRNEISDHIVSIEVNAHLPSGGREEKAWLLWWLFGSGHKPKRLQTVRCRGAFANTPAADEQLRLCDVHLVISSDLDQLLTCLLCILSLIAENNDTPWFRAARKLPRLRSKLLRPAFGLFPLDKREALFRAETLSNDAMIKVRAGKPEDLASGSSTRR